MNAGKKTLSYKNICFVLILYGLCMVHLRASLVLGQKPETNSGLRMGVIDVDVTPEVGERLAWDPVLKTWDLGLRAKGFLLTGSGQPILIIALDWLGIGGEAYDHYKQVLAKEAGTTPERVALHALHQHDAPEVIRENKYTDRVLHRLQLAVRSACSHTHPITHFGTGNAEVRRVASNRRILDMDREVVEVNRMSVCRDSSIRARPEGLIDPEVSVVSFWNEEHPVVIMSFYATHPQSYYRTGVPNPDFPGVARFLRQLAVPEGLHIHFTGAAGNIAAGKYNDGSHENRDILSRRLADGMERAWINSIRMPIEDNQVNWETRPVLIPADTTKNNLYVNRYQSGVKIDLQCLKVAHARLLFMPGELFVEYQLKAKNIRPDLFVAMAAYGDYSPAYIPVAEAFPQGGFEVRASRVSPQAEKILIDGVRALLDATKK